MPKYIILFLIPLFFCINNPAKADVLKYQKAKQEVVLQRQEIKKEILTASKAEKIQLGMKDNKLITYENAYDKAIQLTEQPLQNTNEMTKSNATPFFFPRIPTSGIKPPKEFIPYYKAAAERYGIDWTVLAAIHKIETNYSSISRMVSSVGAIGHMQFMPSTFAAYGVDGNGDGIISPWNVQDSIFTAARYLNANGFENNIRGAIWAYNHASWYVNDVLQTANEIKGEKL